MMETLLGSTVLSTPFWLSVASAAGVGGALSLAWVASSRAQISEAEFRTRSARLPAAVEDEQVEHRLRLRRGELKEVEERLAALRSEFGEAERAAAEAEHWQEMVRKLRADYEGLARERKEVEEVRDAYVRAAADLADSRTRLEDARAQIDRLRAEEADLQRGIEALRAKEAEAEVIGERIGAARAELDGLRAELAQLKDHREEVQLSRVRAEELERRIAELEERRNRLAPELEVLERRKGELAAEIQGLDEAAARQRELVAETEKLLIRIMELQDTLDRSERRVEELRRAEELAAARVREQEAALEALRREVASLESVRDQHRRETETVEELLARHRSLEARLAEREAALDDLAGRIGDRKAEAERLEREIEQLRQEKQRAGTTVAVGTGGGEAEAPDQGAVLADLLRPPPCLFADGTPLLGKAARENDERAMLKRVEAHLKELGLKFDPRTLTRFHTSLKTGRISPMTVLAGISGTGKSQLPQRYAEAMGIHFLKIPVQPRWDSPQDLFGFYNYLEQRYKATDFARALVHMERHGAIVPDERRMGDRVLLVLLDEMNLARVEYYFSEFLSRLEGRPGPEADNEDLRRPSRIEIEVGADHERSLSVYPDHNVLFVGTMNQDESTQALSDKVLDRANVIRFPRPEKLEKGIADEHPSAATEYLPFATWMDWHRSISALPPEVARHAEGLVERLNGILDRIRRPFGHRVNQAILSYVANHPEYESLAGGRRALSDMMELRVLPKLRGVELDDAAAAAFNDMAALVQNELADQALSDAIRKAARDVEMFDWAGMPTR